jgi:hypothetical protein
VGLCIGERSPVEIDNFGELSDHFEAYFFISDILLVVHMLCFQVGLLQILQELIHGLNSVIG